MDPDPEEVGLLQQLVEEEVKWWCLCYQIQQESTVSAVRFVLNDPSPRFPRCQKCQVQSNALLVASADSLAVVESYPSQVKRMMVCYFSVLLHSWLIEL